MIMNNGNSAEIDISDDVELDTELGIFDFSNYPLPKKTKNTLRLFYNNINGVEINAAIQTVVNNKQLKQKHEFLRDLEHYTKIESFVQQMHRWEVDISVLAEPCIEWRDSIPRQVVKDISKKYDRTSNWTVATSSCYSGSFVKPGGALIYSTEKVVGKILERGTDPWKYGRWSYVKYGGKSGRSVLVIGGYRVGHRSGSAGASTAWFQQKVLLTKDKRAIEPEEAFIQDMEEWIQLQQNENTEILLLLDANERWKEQARIKQMANNLELKELLSDGGYDLPASHPCITNRSRDTTIDFCLCSQGILDSIKYATRTPFDLYTLGDHRGLLIDINIKNILLSLTESEESVVGRKLATNNPAATNKYLEIVMKGFKKQNIYDRAGKLYHQWSTKKRNRWDTMTKYDTLDREIFHICRKAEKECRVTVNGRYQWSPALASAIKTLTYWKARKKYGYNATGIVKKLSQELNIQIDPKTDDEIQRHINESREKLIQIQTDAVRYRQDHLEELANQYAKENNLHKANAISELISHESVRKTFGILREKLKPTNRGQLSKVWVAKNRKGEYVKDMENKLEFSTEDEVHTVLLRRNSQHLGQAAQTPFASGEWNSRLKWDGTGTMGIDILNGTILNQEKFGRTVQLYFESLTKTRFSGGLKLTKPHLSLEEYKRFWRKKREETVTSPFGLHVGHFKAATQQDEILNVHRIMLLLPFQTALVPNRWKKTVQTMLEKDPGHPWIHRLRIIELFDAQVNAGFQIFIGRKLIWEAVKMNKLHPASYGSTPGKMASSAVLQKVLSIDQLRLERRAGGLFDCDAKGCYDRIIPPLAAIHLQALGLEESIATFLARFMFLAQRFVKTKHGVSRNSIRTTHSSPLFGIGQGNGGGPAIWLAHLTVMFTALSSICSGLVVYCIKGIEFLCTVGTGYVDDVTLVVSLDRETAQTETNVKKKIQRMASTWEKLLYVTGGKLELSKCFWTPITWQWRKGVAKMKNDKDSGCNLNLKDSESGHRITIPKISPAAAEKRLGIRYSLDGRWTQEYKHWKAFTAAYAQKVQKARLDRLGGYHSYATLWCARFRYSAPIVSFTIGQIEKIQKHVVGSSLAAAGYSSKMPRAVVFGPMEWGGMNWDSAYVISVYEQIKLLIGSLRMEDTVGKLMKLQLQWLQIFSGISTPLLEVTQKDKNLPHGWLQSLHEKLVDNRLQIRVTKSWVPKPRRQQDQIIMDYVRRNLPEDYWQSINQCRLYLKALTFSDITTFDGMYVPNCVYEVKSEYRQSRLHFPFQPRPSKKVRKRWKYFMRHISDEHGKLFSALGKWTRTPYQLFPYFLTEDANLLYKMVGNKWEVYYLKQDTRNTYHSGKFYVESVPKILTPINVIRLSNSELKGIVPECLIHKEDGVKEVGTFTDEHIKNIVGTFTVNESELTQLTAYWHTQKINLVVGSDGGLKDGIGTSAYVFFLGASEEPVIYGYAAERQHCREASSTRQELLAQLSVEYWIAHLINILGEPIEELSIKLITDSQASIMIRDRMSRMLGMRDYLRAEVDVAMEIHHHRKINDNCTRLEIVKVQSHIEIENAPDEFFWTVNEEADRLATHARDEVLRGRLTVRDPCFLDASKATCVYNGQMCISNLKDMVQTAIHAPDLRDYLCRKYGWLNSTFDLIDWPAHQTALKKYTLVRRVTIMKLIHGWLATKRRRWREGQFDTPRCLLCQEEETTSHMYCCTHETIRTGRIKDWQTLIGKIQKITAPETVEALQAGINSVMGHTDIEVYRKEFAPTQLISNITQEQLLIGWDQLLVGRMASRWKEVGPCDEYSATPDVWAAKIVTALIDFGIGLWKRRNQVIHGVGGGPSKLEVWKTEEMIHTLYDNVEIQRHPLHNWLFADPRETKLKEPYSVQVAWVDSIRRLFPDQYRELRTNLGTMELTFSELEYTKEMSTGIRRTH